MSKNRIFNFILILVGGSIAIYAKAEEEQDVYILLAGIILLMIGLYRLSKGISSQRDNNEESNHNDKEE